MKNMSWATKEELQPLYWEKELSLEEIAKLKGKHETTVLHWMKKFGIPRRPVGRKRAMQVEVVLTRKLLLAERLVLFQKVRSLHEQGLNQSDIGRILRIPRGTVQGWVVRGYKPGNEYATKTKIDRTKTREIAYLAGVVASDGSMGHYRAEWRISLQTTDEDFASEFQKTIKTITGKHAYVQRKRRRSHICDGVLFRDKKAPIIAKIASKELYEVLNNTEEYINRNPEAYIRGFADGDGSISKERRNYSKECVYYRIGLYNSDLKKLGKIKTLLHKIGIQSRLRPHNAGHKRQMYRLEIGKMNDVRKFMEKIGFSIKRKQQKWKEK